MKRTSLWAIRERTVGTRKQVVLSWWRTLWEREEVDWRDWYRPARPKGMKVVKRRG